MTQSPDLSAILALLEHFVGISSLMQMCKGVSAIISKRRNALQCTEPEWPTGLSY